MSTNRPALSRGLALGPFLLAGILFAMPWVQVSCSGIPLARLTGLQLALGTSIANPMPGQETQQIPGDWRARLALLSVLAAFPVSLLPTRARNALLCLIGLAGAALLLLMLVALQAETRRPGVGPVAADVQWPYWATLFSLAGGSLLCGSQPLSPQKRIPRGATPPVSARVPLSAETAFCIHCGERRMASAAFCGSCGQRLA